MFQTEANPSGDIFRSLDVIAFDIDYAHTHIHALGDSRDEFELSEFPAGHFKVHFVAFKIEKGREHRGEPPETNGAPFVISKAKMSAKPGASRDAFHRAIEEVHQPPRIL